MAESQAPAAQSQAPSQSSPQAQGQLSADQWQHSSDISPDAGDQGIDEVAAALEAVGYVPGQHNIDGGAGGEDAEPSHGSDKPAPAEKSEPVEAKPASEQTDTVKPSALASFHRQQKELFAQKKAFEAEKAEISKIKEVIDNAKVDRIAALEMLGYTGDNAIKEFLQGLAEDNGRMTPERRELLEMKKWRQEVEAREKAQAEQHQTQAQQQQIQAKLDQIRANVQNRLQSPDYEGSILSLKESDHQVMLEMDRMATESGVMPEIDVAIKNVQNRFQGVLEELAENPAVQEFFQNRLGQSKLGSAVAAQSKQREKTRTIGRDTRSPGTQVNQENDSSGSRDPELDEAVKWVRQFSKR